MYKPSDDPTMGYPGPTTPEVGESIDDAIAPYLLGMEVSDGETALSDQGQDIPPATQEVLPEKKAETLMLRKRWPSWTLPLDTEC